MLVVAASVGHVALIVLVCVAAVGLIVLRLRLQSRRNEKWRQRRAQKRSR
jgi:hypothetical protein